MRTMLKIFAALLGTAIVFVTWRVVVLTSDGNILWFASERKSTVFVQGKPSDGWLHRDWRYGVIMIVTRSSVAKRESYLVTFPSARRSGSGWVQGCNGWTAPHFPLFPYLNPASDGVLCNGIHPDVSQPDRKAGVPEPIPSASSPTMVA